MVRFEKSTSSHLSANNSLRRSPVVTSSMTIKRKHESKCSRRLWISFGVQHLRGTLARRALTNEGDRISALFEPLIADCVIEQHAE